MNKSEAINDLAAALAKAQSEIKGALADSKNPFFKSNYADLGSLWECVRGPLTKNGLSVVQMPQPKENGVEIETTVLHSSGQWISGSLFMPAEKTDPQTFGKLVTYCRRYSLASVLCVPQLDDDAESAMGRVDDPKVKNVTKVQAKSNFEKEKTTVACEHTWLPSTYNKTQDYCSKCKLKRPRAS